MSRNITLYILLYAFISDFLINSNFAHRSGESCRYCVFCSDFYSQRARYIRDSGMLPLEIIHLSEPLRTMPWVRTIMAYPPGLQVRKFSSPKLFINGIPLGVEGKNDNRRVAKETLSIVSKYSDTLK